MQIFKEIKQSTHEKVIYFYDPISNLKAIIAVHNTVLGPSLGGCRMMPYLSEDEALADVLRLSEGMTYKAAMAGLHLGGGKAVILADPQIDKNENLLKAFGHFVNQLDGKYITAEDMGMTVKDMEIIKKTTDHVTGLSQSLGGSGDPSPVTAYGVYVGMSTFIASAGVHTSIDRFTVSEWDYKTIEYTVHIIQPNGKMQGEKVLYIQNGTTGFSTNICSISNSSSIVSVAGTINGTEAELIVTPEATMTGMTTYRFVRRTLL